MNVLTVPSTCDAEEGASGCFAQRWFRRVAMAEERVRCHGALHRLEWTATGPRSVAHEDGVPEKACAKRVDEWTRLGIELHEVAAWIDADFPHPADARRWRGLTLEVARSFRDAGLPADEALMWAEAGVSSDTAVRWREAGLDSNWLRRYDIAELPDVEAVESLRTKGLALDIAVRAAKTVEHDGVDSHWLVGVIQRLEALPDQNERFRAQMGVLRACEAGQSADQIEFCAQPDSPSRLEYLGLALSSDWFEAGVPPAVASEAASVGWTVGDTTRAIEMARTPRTRTSTPRWLQRQVAPAIDEEALESDLRAAGLPDDWVSFGSRDVLDASMTTALASASLPLMVVRSYFDFGIADPVAISAWFEVGISGRAAATLSQSGLSPSESLAWLGAGFLPAEIVAAVAAGESAELARSPRADRRWSDALTRSRGWRGGNGFSIRDTDLGGDVWAVLSTLAVPQSRSSMMFSSAHTTQKFLDGGRKSTDGYGFGSVSGSWIVGFRSFRFICARLGVPQPRQLKGEEAILTPPQLEAEFIEQLHSDWRAALEWEDGRPTGVSPGNIADLSWSGIGPEEWQSWAAMGCSVYQAQLLKPCGTAWVKELIQLGLSPDEVQKLVLDSKSEANYDDDRTAGILQVKVKRLKSGESEAGR